MSLMDSPGEETQIELALILSGKCRDEDTAIDELGRLQVEIRRFVSSVFPNIKFDLCQAMYGSPDPEKDK